MGLFEQLGDMVYQALYALVKPFFDLINFIINGLVSTVNEFIGLVNDIYGLVNTVYSLLANTLGAIFPSAWTALILIGLLLVVAFRIYFLIRGSKS